METIYSTIELEISCLREVRARAKAMEEVSSSRVDAAQSVEFSSFRLRTLIT